jgi:hypothetical protein
LLREFYDDAAAELVKLRDMAADLNQEMRDRLADLEEMFEGDEEIDWDTPLFDGDPEMEEWERSHLRKPER